MRLLKVNNLEYQIEGQGSISVGSDNNLTFDLKTGVLEEIFDRFLDKIKPHIKGDYIFYKGDNPFLKNKYLDGDEETVIIFLRKYTYLIESDYLEEVYIKSIFKSRGNWQEGNIEDGYVDFLFVQGEKQIRNKKLWTLESLLVNRVTKDSTNSIKKDRFRSFITPSLRESFLNPQITLKLTPKTNPEDFRNFIEENGIVIMKPTDGYAGKGIRMIKNFEDFQFHIKELKRIKAKEKWSDKRNKNNEWINNLDWVLERYIIDPHLYKGKKYHFRVYYIFSSSGKSFINKQYRIALALDEYKKEDFNNTRIHDTHYREEEEIITLEQILKKSDYENVSEQLKMLFSNISQNLSVKCYPESKICFHMFGADIILESDMTIKLIEINSSPGFTQKTSKLAKEFFTNCVYHIVDPILPPKKEVQIEDKFISLTSHKRNPRGALENTKINFIDELAKSWHNEGYGPIPKKDKTGGYYLTCKEGAINQGDFHIHIVGPRGKIHLNSWSRKVKERRRWEALDFRLTPKEQAYHIYVKSGYRNNSQCLYYYKKFGKIN